MRSIRVPLIGVAVAVATASGPALALPLPLSATAVAAPAPGPGAPGSDVPEPAASDDVPVPGSTRSLPLVPLAGHERSAAPGARAAQGLPRRDVEPFSMVGVVWEDPGTELHGTVQVRTRSAATGAWSPWQDLEVHQHDHAADPGTAEAGSDAVRGGTAPLWVGASDGVEVRVRPEAPGERGTAPALPRGLRVELIDPGDAPAAKPGAAPGAARDAGPGSGRPDAAPADDAPHDDGEVDGPADDGTDTPTDPTAEDPTAEDPTAEDPVDDTPTDPTAADPTAPDPGTDPSTGTGTGTGTGSGTGTGTGSGTGTGTGTDPAADTTDPAPDPATDTDESPAEPGEADQGAPAAALTAEESAASAVNADLAAIGATEIPALTKAQTEEALADSLADAGSDSAAGSGATTAAAKPYIGPRPRIVTRKGWGADEKLREPNFLYTKSVQAAFVHHSATGNNYTCAQAPSVLRGIYRYHVQSMGWRDIGYNFAIDKCGTIYEGRAGGVAKPVQGAHTLGFNANTTGIAVLGSFASTTPPAKAVTGVARLTAWKLGLHGKNPRGKSTLTSGGGNLYKKGTKVQLNTISGHRDGYSTACPGTKLYGKLGTIRSAAADYQGRP